MSGHSSLAPVACNQLRDGSLALWSDPGWRHGMESGPSPCLPGPGLPESGPTLLTLSTLDIIFPLAPDPAAWSVSGPGAERGQGSERKELLLLEASERGLNQVHVTEENLRGNDNVCD